MVSDGKYGVEASGFWEFGDEVKGNCFEGKCYDFSLFLTPTRYQTNFRTPNNRRDSYL